MQSGESMRIDVKTDGGSTVEEVSANMTGLFP